MAAAGGRRTQRPALARLFVSALAASREEAWLLACGSWLAFIVAGLADRAYIHLAMVVLQTKIERKRITTKPLVAVTDEENQQKKG